MADDAMLMDVVSSGLSVESASCALWSAVVRVILVLVVSRADWPWLTSMLSADALPDEVR